MTIVEAERRITGGVDTHLDVNVAAALDEIGGLLGVESFTTTAAGNDDLIGWLDAFGTVDLVGVEGTGSYGASLARALARRGVAVVEVDQPNRQRRRQAGKSDPIDAVEAARAAQGGRARGHAKSRIGKRGGDPGVERGSSFGSVGAGQDHEPDPPSRLHRPR